MKPVVPTTNFDHRRQYDPLTPAHAAGHATAQFLRRTQRSYIHYIAGFATHYRLSPDRLGLDDVRNYQLHLIEQKRLSPQSINCFVAAAKFLYTVTLDMPWSDEGLTRLKVPEKLPFVLSIAEVQQFFSYVGILKHRADFPALMKLLGHASPEMTMVYLDIALTDLQREFDLARLHPRHAPPPPRTSSLSTTGFQGVLDALLTAQHVVEMYRRALPDGSPRRLLDRFVNRLTKILPEIRKLQPPSK